MPVFLSKRRPNLIEYMDHKDCDPALLENTYRQFATINLLLSQWKSIYKNELRPLMHESKTYTLLDIGFGGGDVPIQLTEWAKKDGIDVKITAIETDKRAFDYVQKIDTPNEITFKYCSSTDLLSESVSFDFVISNHVLHHLSEHQTNQILKEAKALASQKVIFNDIERSDIGFALFTTFARLIFRNSFIVADGLTSIKRSYTKAEIKEMIPKNWTVKRLFPFRLLLIHDKS
ncbi:methyltransferase domain-containing protein [Gracilimonas sp.]|uniref:methyltransferase domain-containing protein n=1 Tax=Gracilimonas sp. TaxID=1974203 RepID=UPI0032EF50D9